MRVRASIKRRTSDCQVVRRRGSFVMHRASLRCGTPDDFR
ncbi:MAG: 50S ribosomal protein L36 [Betaproteobacteria bacterium]|nr:50S ribosomal protein L36 [Betaproteobacteria bacterium]